MKSLILASLLVSSASFAANVNFKSLDCSLNPSQPKEFEKAFHLVINLEKRTSAINRSGLDQILKADMTVTYSIAEGQTETKTIKDIQLGQTTSAYGYTLHAGKRILGSQYPTNISLQPKTSWGSLVAFTGTLELNALVNDNDAMLINTSSSGELTCIPSI